MVLEPGAVADVLVIGLEKVDFLGNTRCRKSGRPMGCGLLWKREHSHVVEVNDHNVKSTPRVL